MTEARRRTSWHFTYLRAGSRGGSAAVPAAGARLALLRRIGSAPCRRPCDGRRLRLLGRRASSSSFLLPQLRLLIPLRRLGEDGEEELLVSHSLRPQNEREAAPFPERRIMRRSGVGAVGACFSSSRNDSITLLVPYREQNASQLLFSEMCTAFFLFGCHSRVRFLMVFNRDEFLDR